MFNRFATVLHNAVDALAPPLPAKDEFVYHWKAITKFFVDRRSDSKAPIEYTNIPGHLEQMLMLLLMEEEESERAGDVGACMEYLLQHKLLDTLQTLARADCPPGMKQHILVFVCKLLSRIKQPLLPHVSVYKPLHHLIKLCGEVKAAPTENEEIQFICIICSKLKEDPSLVNFFLDIPRRPSTSEVFELLPTSIDSSELPDFNLVTSLLTLCQSADSHVAIKACEGLMLCSSLPVEMAARCLAEKTKFTTVVAERLCSLYNNVPKTFEHDLLDQVDARWGLDAASNTEDIPTFPGKRQVIAFLSWLDYCDQIILQSNAIVGRALARAIHGHFLKGVLEPQLCQISESTAIAATAWLIKCVKHISSECLLQEFAFFLLGEGREPEIPGVVPHPIKQLLLDRCSHDNDEVMLLSTHHIDQICHVMVKEETLKFLNMFNMKNNLKAHRKQVILITLRLFETLLENPVEMSIYQLVLANLVNREYYDSTATDYLGSWSDEEDERIRKRNYELDISPGSSPISRTMAPSSIHKVINCFLLLLPDELKSCESEEDMGYDNYLRDAHRQVIQIAVRCSEYNWPHEAISREEMHHSDSSSSESQAEADYTCPFYEGSFLAMLFDKMEGLLDQSYDVNLQITSIMSKLAHLPHPNLHEFLLNPLIPLVDGSRTLFSCLEKVVGEIQVRIQKISNFKRKLYLTRRVLLGDSADYSSVDGSNLLEGLIVLEEFCKELAAISFVKYHNAS